MRGTAQYGEQDAREKARAYKQRWRDRKRGIPCYSTTGELVGVLLKERSGYYRLKEVRGEQHQADVR